MKTQMDCKTELVEIGKMLTATQPTNPHRMLVAVVEIIKIAKAHLVSTGDMGQIRILCCKSNLSNEEKLKEIYQVACQGYPLEDSKPTIDEEEE